MILTILDALMLLRCEELKTKREYFVQKHGKLLLLRKTCCKVFFFPAISFVMDVFEGDHPLTPSTHAKRSKETHILFTVNKHTQKYTKHSWTLHPLISFQHKQINRRLLQRPEMVLLVYASKMYLMQNSLYF